MAYSPPYFSVNGMMVFVLAYKMASKVSQYIMAYRKIPFCLWHIDVGLHTFIFLFMTYYKGPLFQAPKQVYILCHN